MGLEEAVEALKALGVVSGGMMIFGGVFVYITRIGFEYFHGSEMERYKKTHPETGQLHFWPVEKPSPLKRLYTALDPRYWKW